MTQSENPTVGRSRNNATARATKSWSSRLMLVLQQHLQQFGQCSAIQTVGAFQHPRGLDDRVGTNAPSAMKRSAAAQPLGSPVKSLTSTFVSTARMALQDLLGDRLVHLLDRKSARRTVREHLAANVLE
jgi:hypothetical protein